MSDYRLQTRIPQELMEKLSKVIKEIQEKTEVADVTTSSITRASLERFVKQYEKEKNNVITVDFPLNELTREERNELHTFLSKLYQSISNRKAKENPEIKTNDSICYQELLSFKSICDGAIKCIEYLIKNDR